MGGALYATTNGGATWHPLPLTSDLSKMMAIGGNITLLDFTSNRDGWALLRLPGESGGRLLRTTDGGKDWIPVGWSAGAGKGAGASN